MAISNFIQWNPTAANQENDAAYLADSQRAGGASDPSIFDAALANKLFYQLSTGMSALMDMMAYKGFSVSDSSLSTLQAQLANILTTADLRGYGGLQSVPYATSIVLNAGQYLNWQVALNGPMSITVAGASPGDVLSITFVNDSAGNHVVTWNAPFVSVPQPAPMPGAASVATFIVRADSTVYPDGPMMTSGSIVNTTLELGTVSNSGITGCIADNTSIGLLTPAGGRFTSAAATLQMTAPTVVATDSSTNVATTAWATLGLSVSLGGNGYVGLPSWLGGWMLQWGTTGTLPSNATSAQSFNGAGFPTTCLALVGVDSGPRVISGLAQAVAIAPTSRTGFNVLINGSGETVTWIAVGK